MFLLGFLGGGWLGTSGAPSSACGAAAGWAGAAKSLGGSKHTMDFLWRTFGCASSSCICCTSCSCCICRRSSSASCSAVGGDGAAPGGAGGPREGRCTVSRAALSTLTIFDSERTFLFSSSLCLSAGATDCSASASELSALAAGAGEEGGLHPSSRSEPASDISLFVVAVEISKESCAIFSSLSSFAACFVCWSQWEIFFDC
mmetsp:Transcript_11346/g.46076  ORF Transcript_11346/g.46076 Transcript_11346/m.46076 type:complete len:202 (-) Transcript_11346:938-1543(-)